MEPKRLFDLMTRQVSESPLPDALAAKSGEAWVKFSTADVLATADELSLGLAQLGIGRGDRVAIISMNRPEWVFADLAILQLGAISVPIYPTATPTDYAFILKHSEARVVFVSNTAIWEKVKSAGISADVYSFDEVPGVKHWRTLADLGRTSGDRQALSAAKEAVSPDDLASLIYTSGTTGTPKGVMLTHANILANVIAVAKVMPTAGLKRALSFLPLSHVFERTVCYFYQYRGIAIYYAESIDTVAKNLKEVHPNVFVTVPRLLEKVYDSIMAKGRELTGLKRRLFDWAVALGLEFVPGAPRSPLMHLKLAVAQKLIFSKWQEALGGELRLIVVGGSALQPRLARIFSAVGLDVLEGYGLTETSPVIACNLPQDFCLGTVGPVLANLQVRIQPEEGYRAGEGEILVKGPSVMQGYFRNPEGTKEALDADGWFHTGDIGLFESGRYLKITDRKKEMFKTSGGKYIAPLAIEGKFKESRYIAQVMVVGENQKFPSALIVPEWTVLKAWCDAEGVSCNSPAEGAENERVRELFSGEIQRLNQGFGQWEKVKQFRLVADEWTIAAGELTPKLSLRRKVIAAKYQRVIAEIYG